MNGRPPTVPPALAKEIQAALSAGRPLPPGVVAVREGETPPPGSVPTGMRAQMAPGMQPQMPPSKAQHNPLPDGDEGLKILRGFSDCPIPQEAAKLNHMLQLLLQNPITEDETADEILSKGLLAAMRANRYCALNKKTRTVCIFAEDKKLAELHTQIQEEQTNLERINKELEECVKRGNNLLSQRWSSALETYGLNPDKYLYHVDEERGIIEQVDLDCVKCKGVTIIRHARQETAEKMVRPTTPPSPAPDSEETPATTEEKQNDD